MNQEDNAELYRLCGMLGVIADTLPAGSPLQEGLQKGAIAIQAAFIHGHRRWVEDMYGLQFVQEDLSDEQRSLLNRLGINPEAHPADA
jgi:hypothetical protein